MPDENFGEILRRERTRRKWTLREMAKRVGSNYAYISQLESGLGRPSEDLVNRIASAFALTEEEREIMLFVARDVHMQIREIREKYPHVAPKYFREAAQVDARSEPDVITQYEESTI
jgi:transcriptional regulator with XRE-family HTH domain